MLSYIVENITNVSGERFADQEKTPVCRTLLSLPRLIDTSWLALCDNKRRVPAGRLSTRRATEIDHRWRAGATATDH